MKRKILITAALPYANGSLHFGHLAGAYLPSDCYARFERLQGNEVLFISGSDEYGVAITLSAELAGKTPQEHVDVYHAQHQEFFRKVGILFDHYSRTTWKGHTTLVEQFFLTLLDKGYIEERETEQLYSEEDKRFLADRYVVGVCPRCGFEEARGDECGKCAANYEATDLKNPRSRLTFAPLVRKKTRHFFMLFDRFKENLEVFLRARDWKSNVTHFARRYIDELKERAITRDLEWGIPVPLPQAKGKVFYVWFDAPIGYISATQEWAEKSGEKEKWRDFWLDPKTKYVQFVGKDNIPFHAVFFPAMVMGQDVPYKLVDDLVANEFYNLEGKQFSKSEGWTIDTEEFFRNFSVDQLRYALAAGAPETSDAEFSWKEFQSRCNADLSSKLGNLVHRVLVFAQNHCGGKIPPQGPLEEVDHRFISQIHHLMEDIKGQYSAYRLRKAAGLLMDLAQAGNAYFDHKAPWRDAKEEKTRPLMETTIALCLNALKAIALAATPIIPETAHKIFELIDYKPLKTWDALLEDPLIPGTPLPAPYVLFTKVEDTVIEEQIRLLAERHKKATEKLTPPFTPLKEAITIDDVKKLDLRIGTIIKAEKLPKSKKLLHLHVDIGLETRTLLSGISEHYTPEQLIGKKVIVVANLKPAKIMGVESQGMILAASYDNTVELITLRDLPAGSEVS